MNDTPWDPFDQLLKEVAKAVAHLGMEPVDSVMVPKVRGMQIMFILSPDALEGPEAKKTREQFENMMAMEHELAQREKVEQARERAQKMAEDLANGGLDGVPES